MPKFLYYEERCPWDVSKKPIKDLERTIIDIWSRRISPEEAREEFKRIRGEIIDECIAEHADIPKGKVEEFGRINREKFEETLRHCDTVHSIFFMDGLEHFGEPDPRIAWDTALNILNGWVSEKKRLYFII